MGNQHEEHILQTIDGMDTDPNARIKKLKNNAYYQQLQQEISNKKERKVNKIEDHSKQASSQISQQLPAKTLIKPKFKWANDHKGMPQIQPKEKTNAITPKPMTQSAGRILNFLGYKIDLQSRQSELMEKYQKYFVDSRSDNFLMARFSQLKFGMVQMILSTLGLSTEELQALQKSALKYAISENKTLFAQNEYNTELLVIFSAGGRKDLNRKVILAKLQDQLIKQMELLGNKTYYTQERKIHIKKQQVKKILQELIDEKNNLIFVRDLYLGNIHKNTLSLMMPAH